MLHIALCCLKGSTMSNLVHRRRRCARIVLQAILCLEGSTPEDGSGAAHQAKDSVVAPGEPILYCQGQLFCFVAFLVCQWADKTGGEVQAGKLACMDKHHRLTERA